jgi:hypothetical protein
MIRVTSNPDRPRTIQLSKPTVLILARWWCAGARSFTGDSDAGTVVLARWWCLLAGIGLTGGLTGRLVGY